MRAMKKYEHVVCGAGIVGLATAYYLAVKYREKNILLLDKLPPLSLTTSKSGENYRDYWPQTCMADFTSHSIDLMQALIDEHGDVFAMHSGGYDFVSEHTDRPIFPGACTDSLTLYDDASALREQFPWLGSQIRQVAHINRAGAFDVQALGTLLMKRARASGVEFLYGEVRAIGACSAGGFTLALAAGGEKTSVETDQLVLAAGPFVRELARMLDIELPVSTIRQHKFLMPDPLAVIPRDMPFTIFADPQYLDWDDSEREMINGDPDYTWLLDEFPAGLHIKPQGGGHVKLGWAYNREPESPHWQPDENADFPSVVLRGASRFIPGLRAYRDKMPTPLVQFSGYYTRTPENWPLIGPLELPGLYAAAALSGYGTMAACAAGELCADHMMGDCLPSYARQFHPNRYEDPEVLAEIAGLSSDGQL
jgi:glycine/D-amino acid oxidase-like deaminating enzyme